MKSRCVEPPCGQLNPAVDELYDVLENIYRLAQGTYFFWAIIEIFLKLEFLKSSTRDWLELFKPTTFHVGGDEVE